MASPHDEKLQDKIDFLGVLQKLTILTIIVVVVAGIYYPTFESNCKAQESISEKLDLISEKLKINETSDKITYVESQCDLIDYVIPIIISLITALAFLFMDMFLTKKDRKEIINELGSIKDILKRIEDKLPEKK